MYQTTGPGYELVTFNSSQVTVATSGSGRIDFCPAVLAEGTAVFTYNLNGVTQTKQMVRLPFGNAPVSLTTDFTDLWWNANESGWGVNITQKGNNLFAAWYGYDLNRRPLFAIMPGVHL